MSKETKDETKEELKAESNPTPDTHIEDLLKSVEDLKGIINDQSKKISILETIADKKALALYQSRHRESIPPVTGIREFPASVERKLDDGTTIKVKENKVVVGWRTVIDDVQYDPRTRTGYEKQDVELIYQDGTTEVMPLVVFNRGYVKVLCDRIGMETKEDGGIIYRLRRQDTKEELLMSVVFVN